MIVAILLCLFMETFLGSVTFIVVSAIIQDFTSWRCRGPAISTTLLLASFLLWPIIMPIVLLGAMLCMAASQYRKLL